jgi:hypothetical protein
MSDRQTHATISLAHFSGLPHAFFCDDVEHIANVPERDENTEAVRNVEKVTDSKPVRGETLLRSWK